MALQSIEGAGFWIPNNNVVYSRSVSGSTYVIDASGDRAALVFTAPKAGTLDRFDAYVHTVANSPENGLRFSFQSVSTTTGLNTGTILGATNNALTTYAHTVTTGWKSTNFSETVTVARGDVVACVIDIPSFTASDNVAIGHHDLDTFIAMPYGISAAGTKQSGFSNGPPLIVPHYTDGYAYLGPQFSPAHAYGTNVYGNGSSPDEVALAFSFPGPFKINGVSVNLTGDSGAPFDIVVYDGTTPVGTALSVDANQMSDIISPWPAYFPLGSEVTCSANTVYRVAIKPTTGDVVITRNFDFNSLALLQSVEGGDNVYMSTRTDAGSWSDWNASSPGFRRPMMAVNISAIGDDAGSGGGAHIIGS